MSFIWTADCRQGRHLNTYIYFLLQQGVAGQFDGGYFAAPVTTLEGALLETEGLGSRKLSIKENLHGIVAGLLQVSSVVHLNI